MWNNRKIVWSPVEVDYLKENKDRPISQLSIALAKSRNAVTRKLNELKGIKPKTQGKRNIISRIGKRKDLGGLFVRSGWEANTCRWFNHKKINYLYEPKTFPFFGIAGQKDVKHGTIHYVPDFRIEQGRTYKWVEVKGMLKSSDKTRIRRLKKYYPEEFKKLVAIVGSKSTKAAEFFKEMNVPIMAYYNDLNKEFKDSINHWE